MKKNKMKMTKVPLVLKALINQVHTLTSYAVTSWALTETVISRTKHQFNTMESEFQ